MTYNDLEFAGKMDGFWNAENDNQEMLDTYHITADNGWWAEAYKSRNKASGIIRCAVRTRGSMYYRARDWDDALRMTNELVAAWNNGIDIENTEEYTLRSGLNTGSHYPW